VINKRLYSPLQLLKNDIHARILQARYATEPTDAHLAFTWYSLSRGVWGAFI